jgi:hypothetical protein
MKIERDRAKRRLVLSQRAFAERITKEFLGTNIRPAATPMDYGTVLEPTEEGDTDATEELKELYQRITGSLMFLSIRTRPEITFEVSYLSRFNHNPAKRHLTAAKRVLRYIYGSLDRGIVYEGPTDDLKRKSSKTLNLALYSDSNYATDPITRKS